MTQRPFRIFALPLARLPVQRLPPKPTATRPNPSTESTSTPASTSAADAEAEADPLLLFQVSQPDPPPPSTSSSRFTISALANRGLNGAQDQWLKLSKKKPDSWLFWFYTKGEGLMDKIEYEEWMLKGVHEGRGVSVLTDEERKGGVKQHKIEISLLRPELKNGPQLPPLVPKLQQMLQSRIPYHKKMMWRSVIFSPLTWPFAIIPVLPNFPLFYVLWRAWSHYKAWRGAYYLDQLLKLDMIKESPSKELTEVYASAGISPAPKGIENHSPDETSTTSSVKESKKNGGPGINDPKVQRELRQMGEQEKGEKVGSGDTTITPQSMVYEPITTSSTTSTPEGDAPVSKPESGVRHPSLLLSTAQIPLLQKTFDLRPAEVLDITRAVEQADLRAKAVDRKNGSPS